MADKKDPMAGFHLLNKDGTRRRDTGMIRKLGISEERRDQLNKRDWTKPREGAADNPENWTTKQCEEKRFSGYRINLLNGNTELWVIGMIKATRKSSAIKDNPGLLADMHEEAFKTVGSLVEVEIPVKRVRPEGKIIAPQFGFGKRRR